MTAESQNDTRRQTAILFALSNPDFYPHPVSGIQVEETHISRVFLTGDFVYKVKKPVDFGFLDYTTLEKRHHYCKQEVLLNNRLSENVYLDVVTITEEPTGYTLNGLGKPVEYAVKMRQLPKERTMLQLVRRGELSLDMLKNLVHGWRHVWCCNCGIVFWHISGMVEQAVYSNSRYVPEPALCVRYFRCIDFHA